MLLVRVDPLFSLPEAAERRRPVAGADGRGARVRIEARPARVRPSLNLGTCILTFLCGLLFLAVQDPHMTIDRAPTTSGTEQHVPDPSPGP